MASHSRASLARRALLPHNILFDLLLPNSLAQKHQNICFTPESSGPLWMKRAGRLRHRHSPFSSRLLALSRDTLAPDPASYFKKNFEKKGSLHPFRALQATTGQDQLTKSSLGSRYKFRQNIFPAPLRLPDSSATPLQPAMELLEKHPQLAGFVPSEMRCRKGKHPYLPGDKELLNYSASTEQISLHLESAEDTASPSCSPTRIATSLHLLGTARKKGLLSANSDQLVL